MRNWNSFNRLEIFAITPHFSTFLVCLVFCQFLTTLVSHLSINLKKHGHCRVPHGYAENRKLSWWVMNQRAQYQMLRQGKKTWLSEDRVWLLDTLSFDWNPTITPRRWGRKTDRGLGYPDRGRCGRLCGCCSRAPVYSLFYLVNSSMISLTTPWTEAIGRACAMSSQTLIVHINSKVLKWHRGGA